LTVNELIHDMFFAIVKKKADSYGVQLSSESVAPTMVSDGMEHYKYVDVPMGEYWLNSPTHDKPNDMLDAISGAHIYGKNIVQAEGFTEVRGVWDETPAMIKPLLDRNFALGMNRLFIHVFTHNPWMDRKPGMTLDGIGLFFQRDQTWFPEAKAFVDYITRCQRLLQEGKPVVDIAVFTGEEMPNRSIRPEQLIDILPGLIGTERVEKERKRMENIGQPMAESPVGVNHSANIVDPKDWVNALNGYQYDSMNKDALLHSDNAFKYSVLVIPQNVIVSPETQERINALRQQGVIIIDKPLDVDSIQGLVRDINLPKDIAYCHRVNGNRHIYFISNQTDDINSFPVTFRNGGENPIIYYPMNDKYSPAKYYTTDKANASTKMNLCLNPYESVFVIFDKEMPPYPIPVASCLHQKRPKGNPAWKQVKDWTLTLKENGISMHTDTLFDWSKHTNDSIRYFSGHARYSTVITCKKSDLKNAPIILSLGEVHDIAHVWVNGMDCGIAWMAPYEIDITQALKKGKNNIEIEITNTWHNALRGADEGKAPYDGIWTNAKYRTKGNDLLPSGLLGPITLKIKDER
ncbi:MAG: DNA-binding protein, partial [Prevotella sp.]|nr:DNA-binding protein [Prevotella sp.]